MGTICTKLQKAGRSQPSHQQVDERLASVESVPTVTEKDHKHLEVKDSGGICYEEDYKICLSEELKENEMEVFSAGEQQVLVVKEKGKIYAMGSKCTHFGAPLKTGIFCEGKVYCPWHGACFNSNSGDIEEFPGLDPIPVYPVKVDPTTGEVEVTIKKNQMLSKNHGIQKPLCKASAENKEIVVIIGSGAAGSSCAETLRQEGFTGRIVVVTKDKYLPYDRTKLSKAMNMEGAALALRSEEYYSKGDIEFLYQISAKALDVQAKSVLLSNDETLVYTHLVIATGGRPRPVPCPGTHLVNVFLLRTPDDANQINAIVSSKECHLVIVGTSFIGMEVAAFFAEKAASVTVIGRDPVPFVPIFGALIGARLQRMHEERGVQFVMDSEVAELVGDEEGNLTEVCLTSGRILKADVLVAGIGVLPSTDFIRGSDVNLDSRGYVPVDKHMRTNCADIYAVGDIASFPLFDDEGERCQLVSIGHWQMALHHGRTAAMAILGRAKPISETTVPFFWSTMFGKSIRYCGYAPKFDDVIIHGDLDNLKFAAFLCQGDTVRAIVTLNFDPLAIQFSALLRERKKLSKIDVVNDPKSWTTMLNAV